MADTDTSLAVELALLRSEERFKDFAALAADIFWETDEFFTITFLSEQQEKITGSRSH